MDSFLCFFIAGMLSSLTYNKFISLRISPFFVEACFYIFLFLVFIVDEYIVKSIFLYAVLTLSYGLCFTKRIVVSAPIKYISRVSYTYYLLHYPLFHALMLCFTNKMNLFGIYWQDFLFQYLVFTPISFLLVFPFFIVFESAHEKKVSFVVNLKLVMSSFISFRFIR